MTNRISPSSFIPSSFILYPYPIMPTKPADPANWKNVLKRPKRGVPEGLWKRCPGCQATIFRKEAEKRLGVCPECDYHWYVPARQRVAQVLDEGTFEEWDADLETADPLQFVDKVPIPRRSRRSRSGPACARRPWWAPA